MYTKSIITHIQKVLTLFLEPVIRQYLDDVSVTWGHFLSLFKNFTLSEHFFSLEAGIKEENLFIHKRCIFEIQSKTLTEISGHITAKKLTVQVCIISENMQFKSIFRGFQIFNWRLLQFRTYSLHHYLQCSPLVLYSIIAKYTCKPFSTVFTLKTTPKMITT